MIDDIALVERAYDLEAGHAQWLDGLHAGLLPHFDRGAGLSIGTWSMKRPGEFDTLQPSRGNVDPRLIENLHVLAEQLPSELLRSRYGPGARDFIGSGVDFARHTPVDVLEAARRAGLRGFRDVLGVLVMGNPGWNGLVMTAFSRDYVRLSPGRLARARKLLAHAAAGLRLRVALVGAPAEAVLTPDGRLVHAEGEAKGTQAAEALRRAVTDIERARGRLRRTSPDEALTLWKGLVSGRWSIVQWVDVDQRRYLVARANPPSVRDPRALSPRELDVAEYVVQGRSSSEIAYALGLAIGTVSRTTRDVLRKLGSPRRTDLAAVFGSVAPFRATLSQAREVVVVRPGSETGLWSRFSLAERSVVEQLLAGSRVAEIARARGVSAKTVTNQLTRLYTRLGVRGRTELAALVGRAGVATAPVDALKPESFERPAGGFKTPLGAW
ncbi:MAG: helix-turn-helix transcriptional regulator [Myxococcaceae bacterium]|nr:helix-turn-helix transcriptional regulator [Myxococcaceae bacterium]